MKKEISTNKLTEAEISEVSYAGFFERIATFFVDFILPLLLGFGVFYYLLGA